MKILHIADLGNGDAEQVTGISEVVTTLVKGQNSLGHHVICGMLQENHALKGSQYYRNARNLTEFKNLVLSFKPDIVIFHQLYRFWFIFYGRFLHRIKIPYCIEFHGGSSAENAQKSHFKKAFAKFIAYNRFMKQSAAFIYLNKREADTSVMKNYSNRDLIIPNGLYCDPEINITKNHSDSIIRITFLARIDIHHKGLDLLFDALELIPDEFRDKLEFSFYGPGGDSEEFKKLLESCHQNVKYLGGVYGDDKLSVLRDSDIYILTSRYEGMPMTVLEALSVGTPCLVSEQTNMADVILKHGCGWITGLSPADIAKTIVKAIAEYTKDEDRYTKASVSAAKEYEWDAVFHKSINELAKIANS